MVAAGDAFHFDPDLAGGNPHLWVVLHVFTPELDTEEYAWIVSITTWNAQGDDACQLNRGDHPFLHHLSYVFYRKALQVPVANLAAGHKRESFSPAVLRRILLGVHTSRNVARKLRQIIRHPGA